MASETDTTPDTTAVSVHLIVQVGEDKKEFDVVAVVADTDPYKMAKAMISGVGEDARDWAFDRQNR